MASFIGYTAARSENQPQFMWPDNETERDYLNFASVSDTVAEIIVQADGRPISIGVSGAWGTGKSSMIKLIQASLSDPDRCPSDTRFVFVDFNAWLYQGYDDARAALMEVIADKLVAIADAQAKPADKAKALLARVNWLRAAKFVANSTVAMSLGLPPTGLLGQLWGIGRRAFTEGLGPDTLQEAGDALTDAREQASPLLEPPIAPSSPPKEIQALRDTFEAALAELEVTLVVLVDDLDRCLPETTISTLEAIRLFLFLNSTAFVIAADIDVIKLAVRRHFQSDGHEADDRLVTSYFDKLVQVPIQVPPLGIQEVRAYMMLLFVEASTVPSDIRDHIREQVCSQLQRSWQGDRVDRAFMDTLHADYPPELTARFETAERLAPIMTSASGIVGNPRLIKRFLNALSIRTSIAHAQGVSVDEAVLAKMLLLERHGGKAAFPELIRRVATSSTGKPDFLSPWEARAVAGEEPSVDPKFEDPFFIEWLALPPAFADIDLRGALYVSREHAPPVTPGDALSTDAIELLTALVEHPNMAATLKLRLADLSPRDRLFIMDRLLENARREQSWGVPAILHACLALTEADPAQGQRLATFLAGRPPTQIRPNIVPKIGDQPWARGVFNSWCRQSISAPVKGAITRHRNKGSGHLAV